MLGQRLAKHRVMGEQHVGVALAELLDESRRAFDIAEKEGDGTGRQAHAGDGDALSSASRIPPSSRCYCVPAKSRSGCGASRRSLTTPSLRRYTARDGPPCTCDSS